VTLAFTLRYSRISSLSCSVIKLANLICLQRHLTVCSRSYETVITYAWRNSSLHSFSVVWLLKCCFWVTHRSTLCRQKCRLQTYIRSIIGRLCLSENGSPFSEVGCIFLTWSTYETPGYGGQWPGLHGAQYTVRERECAIDLRSEVQCNAVHPSLQIESVLATAQWHIIHLHCESEKNWTLWQILSDFNNYFHCCCQKLTPTKWTLKSTTIPQMC